MTAKLPFTFACASYDRMDALRTGEIPIEGLALNFLTINHPRDIFDRMMGNQEFDASEMSSSEYIRAYCEGRKDFVAIPVFPSKVFRHGFIGVDSRQVKSPKDLEGKKVGVQLYTMTAAVWIRGLLAQEGVDPSKIHWVQGAMEHPGQHGKPFASEKGKELLEKKGIKLSPNEDPERSLSDLLADGELAGTIGADLPTNYGKGGYEHVTRLYPDFKEAEKKYYREHGIFPIMHLVVIKRSLVEKHPWIPSTLFNALEESKAVALRRMRFGGATRYMLPWMGNELDEIRGVFGDETDPQGDPWVYGVEENRKTVEKLVQFLYEQGLIEWKPSAEELFWPVKRMGWHI
jgi:4,5-dihydroxyphthalate decarboxylase